MKIIHAAILISFITTSCSNTEKTAAEMIYQNFYNSLENIDRIKYSARNIMTFSDGTIWDNTGVALLEKNEKDTIFGFSFYGKRDDVNRSYVYDSGFGYNTYHDDNKYRYEKGGHYVLGISGGQMVYKDFFKLDHVYDTLMITTNDSTITLQYKFEDDIESTTTDRTKIVELNSETYLPKRITTSIQPIVGSKQTMILELSKYLINDEVEETIDGYINSLINLEPIVNEKPQPSSLLNKQIPYFELSKLDNDGSMTTIFSNKVTLIDFWEVWCGPCIKSFPEVQRISDTYGDKIDVIGIVGRDFENAQNLLEKKNISIPNFMGTQEIKDAFGVNSYPRYYLINEEGIVSHEYRGYSDNIEKDIQLLIHR